MSDLERAVLILDKMPEKCTKCNLSVIEEDDKFTCMGLKRKIPDVCVVIDCKPEWCPLKSFPKKQNALKTPSILSEHFAMGWNACIEEIEK